MLYVKFYNDQGDWKLLERRKMKKMPEMAHLKRNVINYTIWMA